MIKHRLAWLALPVLLGCTGDDDTRPPASTEPLGATSSSTADSADDGNDDGDDDGQPSDDDVDPDTGGPPTTSSTTADDDGPDSTGDDNDDDTTTSDTAGGEPGNWLLTVDDAASPPTLVRIDTATGVGETLCPLPGTSSYNSLVLTRTGTLYVHNATQSRIERVDPCDCGFQIVGATSAGSLQLSVDMDDGLLGLDTTLDALYAVNPQTGLANAIGPLGLDFGAVAMTWSDTAAGPYAIDDTTNQLYTLATDSGNATLVATLSQIVANPGLAYRAGTDTTFMCDGNTLYELDTGTGVLTEIGNLGLAGACTSLTAPYVAEACLE